LLGTGTTHLLLLLLLWEYAGNQGGSHERRMQQCRQQAFNMDAGMMREPSNGAVVQTTELL
jgi:hypothetical protein